MPEHSESTTTKTTTSPVIPASNKGLGFMTTLKKYTVTDINNLIKVAIDSESEDEKKSEGDVTIGDGRCTTALASLCFAAIEQLGLLLRSDLSTQAMNALKKGNRDNALSFFNYFRNKPGFVSVSDNEVNAMYTVFRNKITHNLFPKHNLGIAQNKLNPTNQLVININGSISLNVNFISNYVLSALAYLESQLGNINNTGFIAQMDSNIQLIESAEETILKNQYNNNTTSTSEKAIFTQWLPNFQF